MAAPPTLVNSFGPGQAPGGAVEEGELRACLGSFEKAARLAELPCGAIGMEWIRTLLSGVAEHLVSVNVNVDEGRSDALTKMM